MDVNGQSLQKVFAVSSNAADSPITPERERVLFRKIARLIRRSCIGSCKTPCGVACTFPTAPPHSAAASIARSGACASANSEERFRRHD